MTTLKTSAHHAENASPGEPVKFLFDVEFAGGGLESRATLAAVEAEAFRRGQAAGEAEANARIERRLSTALAQAADRIAELAKKFDTLEQRLETEAVEVAVAIANKLASALIAREPLAEVEGLVIDVLAHVRSAPHLVVRVNEDLLDLAGARLKQIADERGFTGRLVLLPAPELKPDEVRIEWADGGVERRREAIETRINEAVARYLARGGSPAATAGPEKQA
ncbi:MAG: flagellar assembly protein FliH [Bradyrhizobiaceae bacterium]|nr:flagellar assembly protein FliH [Bradyrhizobiaceae bacterium]